MRAHYCWRNIASVADYLEALSGEASAFALPGTSAVYAPDRPVVLRHLHLEVKVDPEAETVDGRVTMLIMPVVDEVTSEAS